MTPCPHCTFPRSTAPLEEGEVAVCRWCDYEDELSEVFPFLQEDEEDAISASLSPDDTLEISACTVTHCPSCNFPLCAAPPPEEGEVTGFCWWCDSKDELQTEFPYLQMEDWLEMEGRDLDGVIVDIPFSTPLIPGETDCCICYEKIDAQRNNCVTECGHRFCFKCLATSMMHNTACPCCRSPLVESEDDEDDEDEGSDADTENEYQEDADEDETGCDPEELTRRLAAQGFTMQDMVSMLLGRYNQNVSDAAIFELNKRFDVIVEEADNEKLETEAMGGEDTRREVVCV